MGRAKLDLEVFRCVLCAGRFSVRDIRRGRYFVSTSICRECYEKGQQQDHSTWCFGKTDVTVNGKVVKFGYNAQAIECKKECPDRLICKVFAIKYAKQIQKT